jgi:putative addiction module killer protein
MVEGAKSSLFDTWLRRLRDTKGKAIILAKIERLAAGNPGDVRPVGDGISEMRIAFARQIATEWNASRWP